MKIKWISKEVVLAIHHEQIVIHGGLSGIRDIGLLESALQRPKNMANYNSSSVIKCAAAYIFGIIKNHPFNDGNKRTGFVVGATFLLINGAKLEVDEVDIVITIEQLAVGGINEQALIEWLVSNVK